MKRLTFLPITHHSGWKRMHSRRDLEITVPVGHGTPRKHRMPGAAYDDEQRCARRTAQ